MGRITTRIKIQDLSVGYDGHIALTIPELTLQGNAIALLGHNGAGKSTFIKSLLGLLTPSSGSIIAEGVTDSGAELLIPSRHMAFCPESGAVFEDISVEEYVRFWCRVKHHDALFYKRAGRSYIELLELDPLLKKLGRELSKGQRRRVQTAVGFIIEPKLFLFDEPFDGLDIQKTNELADIIRSFSERMTFIISSHRMDVIERLCDQVLVLKHGEVAASGSVDTVSSSLCGQAAIISDTSAPESVIGALKAAFAGSTVSQLGDAISITGSDFTLDALAAIVREQDRNGARISAARPSLTDAMNFHLKSLRNKAG